MLRDSLIMNKDQLISYWRIKYNNSKAKYIHTKWGSQEV